MQTSGTPSRYRPALLALLACAILGLSLALNGTLRPGGERSGDAADYLLAAYNLAHHGSFAQSPEPHPTLGREPGYPVLLALLMHGTALGGFTPACLEAAGACPAATFRPAQQANLYLALIAAGLVGWSAMRLTGAAPAGLLAFAYIALNGQALKGRWELLSDYLALCLVALVGALLLQWLARPGRCRAIAVGLALAALILTKAIFLYVLLAAVPIMLLLRRWLPGHGLAMVLSAALPVALWAARNWWVGGSFALTDARSGIALSTREVFNHLGPVQLACAFVYWTRGIGDDLARLLFAPAVWQPFALDWPGGYYDIGQHRYMPWVAQLQAERGHDRAAAQQAVDAALVQAMLDHPWGWLAAYPALIWRGLWVDEFVVIGFPALIGVTLWALWRRQAAWLLALGLGWFCLLAYPAISLNIPRYQLPSLPALALGAAWLGVRLAEWRRLRQARAG